MPVRPARFLRPSAELMSWRPATQRVYNTYIHKWKTYAGLNKVSIESPSPTDVCNFLADLFKKGSSYSALNSARSALSAFVPQSGGGAVGNHPLVCRLLKGCFEQRPALPRYTETWDVDIVLGYLD